MEHFFSVYVALSKHALGELEEFSNHNLSGTLIKIEVKFLPFYSPLPAFLGTPILSCTTRPAAL